MESHLLTGVFRVLLVGTTGGASIVAISSTFTFPFRFMDAPRVVPTNIDHIEVFLTAPNTQKIAPQCKFISTAVRL